MSKRVCFLVGILFALCSEKIETMQCHGVQGVSPAASASEEKSSSWQALAAARRKSVEKILQEHTADAMFREKVNREALNATRQCMCEQLFALADRMHQDGKPEEEISSCLRANMCEYLDNDFKRLVLLDAESKRLCTQEYNKLCAALTKGMCAPSRQKKSCCEGVLIGAIYVTILSFGAYIGTSVAPYICQ